MEKGVPVEWHTRIRNIIEHSCGQDKEAFELLKRFVEATVSSRSSEQLTAKIIPLAVDAKRLLTLLPSPPTGRNAEKEGRCQSTQKGNSREE